MKQILLFLQMLLPVFCFSQTYYGKDEIYKIDENLSLRCGPGISVVTLSDADESFQSEYDDLSEDDIRAIQQANFNYNKEDIFKAIKNSFSVDELDRLKDDVDILRIGFVFDKYGKCKYLALVFLRISPNMMAIAPQRYGMLYKNLLKVSFRVVDKRLEYNMGSITIRMKDVRQSIQE